MKNSNYLSRFVCLLLVFNAYQASAQLSKPFSVRYQSYVKGDMAVIANNIVNREDAPGGANAPYNIIDVTSKHNDEFNMGYIDVDDDKSTFSSSSAEFSLKDAPDAKVVYAGIYWSATYKYNSGKQKNNRKFYAVDKGRDSFENIKIKLPNQPTYIDIKGQTIFDGLKERDFEENAPYAAYADITAQVKRLPNPTGTYTVANIKSTTGTLSGGISAGWTIVIVYEDVNQKGKFITTYDGFAGVTSKSTDIDFAGFQTLPEGKVNMKVAGAALEGDSGLKGDQLAFKSAENKEFITLENSIREYNNFFNSSITINDKFFTKRLPNSVNTLGYDTFLINIHNPENKVIGNNTKEAKLRLKSTGDRYFMFFCAMNVEVVEPVKSIQEIIQEPLFADNTNDKPKAETDLKANAVVVAPLNNKELESAAVIASNENSKTIQNEVVKTVEKAIVATKEVSKPKEEAVIAAVKDSAKPIEKEATILVATDTTIKEQISTQPTVEPAVKTAKPTETAVANVQPSKPMVEKEATKTATPVAKSNNIASLRVTPIESGSRSFPGEEKGYYIIANVFAVHSNATRFVDKLHSKGIDAAYFINPANNYRYVYVSHHDKFSDAESLYFSDINNKYHDDLWIMTVNKENDMIVATDIENSISNSEIVTITLQTNEGNNLKNSNLNFFETTSFFKIQAIINEQKLT